MTHAVSWFEIFVADMPRAQAFYERILGQSLRSEVFMGTPNAIFPYDGGVGGALVKTERNRPAKDGALVYLDTHGQLEAILDRVPGAGGKVLVPRTDIGAPGFIAVIQDTEGNSVGLHQRPAAAR